MRHQRHLNISNEMIETVCKDSDGARSVLPGNKVSMTVEGLTAYDNIEHQPHRAVIDTDELELRYGRVNGDPYESTHSSQASKRPHR